MKSFIKNLMFGKKGVSPDIKSVKPTTNITGSVDKVKKDAAFKNFKTVQNLKDKKEKGKKMMQEAQKELRRAVETKRATKIGKSIYHKARGQVQKKFGSINEGIKKETTQLRQTLQKMRGEKVTKSGISKGKDVTPGIYKPLKDKKKQDLAKGGRVGLKFGSKRKSNVQKIKETFGPGSSNPKKSAAKKKKFPDLTGDGKVTFADILKGRGVKRG